MLLTIASSSPPCSHSSSNRLGPTGPLAVLLPWQARQVSLNFATIGLPRPPPRPGPAGAPGAPGVPCGAGAPAGGNPTVGGPEGGIAGGFCCWPACSPTDAE